MSAGRNADSPQHRALLRNLLPGLMRGLLPGVARDLTRKIDNFLQAHWRGLTISVPFLWLLVFFLVPFFIVLKISLAESLIASPPFSPLTEWAEDGALRVRLLFDNFAYLWEDKLYVETYLNSLKISGISTAFCLLIGYPIAYGIVRAASPAKHILLLLIILPFWTSFLLRVYAWMGILADQGTINNILIWAGLIERPVRLLYSEFAVYVGIVYSYLPFMILPLYASMEKLDMTLNEAASDLGAHPAVTFLTVTLPLTVPGIIAGSLLVFIPATGEFVIPDLLGGGNVLMIGKVLYGEFNANRDWPVAAAVAIALLVVLVAPMMLYQHFQSGESSRGAGKGA
ncbi:MAG: putrescine ABC transporter membrane subunit PotH [Arenicellales bacterium IbO2]|nr:MAG: putrescine ABC transporter membrane subunit PotH [Arenicellales bacterium IbO2]